MAGGRRSSILLDLYAMAHLAGGILDPELEARGVQRLVESGLARGEPNPVDGRSALISLTDEGLAHARAGSPAVRAAVARIAEELERPFDKIAAALEDLHRGMRAALASPRQERRSA